MDYSTLMVHLEPGRLNQGLLRVAHNLADRHFSRVIGIAACWPMQIVCDATYIPGEVFESDRAEIVEEIREAEAEFRAAFRMGPETLEWRSEVTLGPLSAYIAQEARCADLIITAGMSGNMPDNSRTVDAGELVMEAGRPVLIIPTSVESLMPDRIVVGWKDTREARRAITDALPLLRRALQVFVVEIASEEGSIGAVAHVADVAKWLSRHGIKALQIVSSKAGTDADRFKTIVHDHGADLVVAGAYGHSRLREWAFGGVTRDLLLDAKLCSLMSH